MVRFHTDAPKSRLYGAKQASQYNAAGIDKGNWRLATEAEMAQSAKGGAGIVLLNARMGQRSKDWIVFKHSMTDGDNIAVADVEMRTRREYGGRM